MSDAMNAVAAAEAPPHVPPHLIYDFDFMGPPGYQDDVHLGWWKMQQSAPEIFWTPRNGGHWVATRGADILTMQNDYLRFSHHGHSLPRPETGGHELPPVTSDPPEHTAFRRLLMPLFMPRNIVILEQDAQRVAASLVEAMAPRGECEFISEFAQVMPITVFLNMMQLPHEDRAKLLPLANAFVRGETKEIQGAAYIKITAYIAGWVDRRIAAPAADPISTFLKGSMGERRISREEVIGMSSLLLLGGLDTVASMLGFIARFLALNPAYRQQLRDDPANLGNAVEELIRRHGIANTSRLITHDFVYNGVPFRQGDQIQLPNLLFGLDDREVEDPLQVNFYRPAPIPHAAFGNGFHTCPGAGLARREIKIFIQEWLGRIPDFAVKAGTKPKLASGQVNAVEELFLSWPV